jgi:hypothetical protein
MALLVRHIHRPRALGSPSAAMMGAVNEGIAEAAAAAANGGGGSAKRVGHCAACFTGEYPVKHDASEW